MVISFISKDRSWFSCPKMKKRVFQVEAFLKYPVILYSNCKGRFLWKGKFFFLCFCFLEAVLVSSFMTLLLFFNLRFLLKIPKFYVFNAQAICYCHVENGSWGVFWIFGTLIKSFWNVKEVLQRGDGRCYKRFLTRDVIYFCKTFARFS